MIALRPALAFFAGALLWAFLWVGGNAALGAAFPEQFDVDGSTSSATLLATMVVYSVMLSLAAGFVAATVASSNRSRAVWVLAGFQLLVGVAVQLSLWDAMPLAYHLPFLAMLVPGVLVGARLRSDGQSRSELATEPA